MNRPKALLLDPDHKVQLKKLAKSGMTPVLIAQKAKILLAKSEGRSNNFLLRESFILTAGQSCHGTTNIKIVSRKIPWKIS